MKPTQPASFTRRLLVQSALALSAVATVPLAHAQDKITVLSSWYPQAEHGGYYQAVATGIYKAHNLEVTIKPGGPAINSMQILLAGQADFIMHYDFAVLQGIERGFPLVTVGAPYQFDMQGVLTREDVPNLGSLKGKTILVAGSGTTYWWPWLKSRYGYTDAQMRPFTNSMQPFFADPNVVQQAYPSSVYEAQQNGMKSRFLLLADDGYPPYAQAITTTKSMVANRPEVVQRFVKATMEGWKSFMENPAPAAELIKKANPQMTDGQFAFTVKALRDMKIVTGGDAAKMGIGAMTDERWKKTADFMVAAGLLKSDTDWRQAYTTRFVKDLRVMP